MVQMLHGHISGYNMMMMMMTDYRVKLNFDRPLISRKSLKR